MYSLLYELFFQKERRWALVMGTPPGLVISTSYSNLWTKYCVHVPSSGHLPAEPGGTRVLRTMFFPPSFCFSLMAPETHLTLYLGAFFPSPQQRHMSTGQEQKLHHGCLRIKMHNLILNTVHRANCGFKGATVSEAEKSANAPRIFSFLPDTLEFLNDYIN